MSSVAEGTSSNGISLFFFLFSFFRMEWMERKPVRVPLRIESADKAVDKSNMSLFKAVGLVLSKYLNCHSPL